MKEDDDVCVEREKHETPLKIAARPGRKPWQTGRTHELKKKWVLLEARITCISE